jgi:hypothetical protein
VKKQRNNHEPNNQINKGANMKNIILLIIAIVLGISTTVAAAPKYYGGPAPTLIELYDITEDGIRLKFKNDSAFYDYTKRAYGEEVIAEITKLAEEGFGLYQYLLTLKEQRKDALRNLDNLCGDVWCEGPYDYSFQNIKCSYGKCTLYYTELSEPPKTGVCIINGATLEDFDDDMQDGEVIANQIFDYFYGLRF